MAGSPGTAGWSSNWNFRVLCFAFGLGIILQMVFLPCLCASGTAKMTMGWVVDGLVAGRVIVAWLIREKGSGWKFYAGLILTSPLWITLLSELIGGH
jgi:hypothetical protein